MFARPSGIVTLATDFGVDDPYVGILKGALLRASSKVQVVDLSHGLPPQDLAAASFCLWSTIGRFPGGTVHVGVIDPGVGTGRQLLAVAAHGDFWLVPDNGLIGAVLAGDANAEVRVLDIDRLGLRPRSNTFHGRDVLAPVAAWLASGRYGFSAMGPRAADARRDDFVFDGHDRVVHIDRFGNLISNVGGERAGSASTVHIAGRDVAVHRTYGEVAAGELLAYVGSFGLLEVAARDGSAAQRLGLQRGAAIAVQSA